MERVIGVSGEWEEKGVDKREEDEGSEVLITLSLLT